MTFAFYSLPDGPHGPHSQLIVVRHLAGGGICTLKSSDQMNLSSVSGTRVTVSGKGEYRCVGPLGVTKDVFNDIDIVLIAEDNGTRGAGQDRIWVSNNSPVANNLLAMPDPASVYSAVLTIGKVIVRPAAVATAQ